MHSGSPSGDEPICQIPFYRWLNLEGLSFPGAGPLLYTASDWIVFLIKLGQSLCLTFLYATLCYESQLSQSMWLPQPFGYYIETTHCPPLELVPLVTAEILTFLAGKLMEETITYDTNFSFTEFVNQSQ